ncbi:MAG: PEP-CTERM sorting domain-containing protein [Luteolibacter sp.]
MTSLTSHANAAATCWIAISSAALAATSIQVSSTGKTEIVGSLSTVLVGGSAANFSTTPVVLGTTSASFQMVLADGSGTRFADLRLTPTAIKGTLDTVGGQSGLMIVQTSNSQGLMDAGTFSILTDFAAANSGGISSMTLRLDWFQPGTTIPLPVAVEMTSFDYDFNQFLRVSNTYIASEEHGSALTYTSSGGVSSWVDGAGSDSSFSNPNNAVILNTISTSSMFIEVGKTGKDNSLFMFEFRDPSINLIPEPSSALLALTGVVGLVLRRRRNA